MSAPVPLCVFSDLDGTLLDHETYEWQLAAPALACLAQIGAPVVLASSKTAAEILPLQEQMGLSAHPAIVENGAGVIGLHPSAGQTGEAYRRLRETLAQLPLSRHFHGFADMSSDEVAQATGLGAKDAILAKTRHFSEPGLWRGDDRDLELFLVQLQDVGISARQGGRFLTLSFGATKAGRMNDITAQYRPLLTVALGDAPNDIEMLESAEIGIIIPNPHGPTLPRLKGEDTGRIRRAAQPGPAGWNAAILSLLTSLDLMTESPAHG